MTREHPNQTPRNDRPSVQPTGTGGTGVTDRPAPMAPGDEAPAGTPGTGENICRTCGGKGVIKNATCPDCEGSGTVIEGIGGA